MSDYPPIPQDSDAPNSQGGKPQFEFGESPDLSLYATPRPESVPPFAQETPEAAVHRTWIGWAILFLFFTFSIGSALNGLGKSKSSSPLEDSRALRTQVILGLTMRANSPEVGEANLSQARDLLKESKDEEVVAWRLLIDRLETPLDKPLPKDAEKSLATLSKSKDASNRAVGEFLKNPDFGKKDAKIALPKALSDLPERDLRKDIARAIVLESQGKKSEAAKVFPLDRIAPMLLAIGGAMFVVFAGVGAWLYFIIGTRTGSIRPKGFPTGPLTESMGDRLALRAGFLMLVFIGMMIFGAGIGAVKAVTANPTLEIVVGLLPYAVMVGLVLLLPKDAVFGEKFTTKGIGAGLEGLLAKVGIGAAGWVANAALLMLAIVISIPLMRVLPTNSHPAGEQMLANPDATTMIRILLMGSVAAPIWEEIVFRGMLFPAISKKVNSVAWGVFLSSLLFAAIHPQGPGAWLLLGTIGGLNCVLTYYTKSLVPGIVLHMLNNTAVFAFAYFSQVR